MRCRRSKLGRVMSWILIEAILLTGCGKAEEEQAIQENSTSQRQAQENLDYTELRFGSEDEKPLVVYMTGSESGMSDGKGDIRNYFPTKYSIGTELSWGEIGVPQGNAFVEAVRRYSEETGTAIEIHIIESYFGATGDLLQTAYATKTNLPDMVIGGKSLGYDFVRLAEQELLLDLTPYITEDEALADEGQYYTKVIQGGRISKKQYLMPLLFDFNVLYTSESYLNQIGMPAPNIRISYAEVMQLLLQSCLAMQEEQDIQALAEMSGRMHAGDYFPSILLGAAYPSYWNEDMQFVIEPEILREMWEMLDEFLEQEYMAFENWRERDFRSISTNMDAKFGMIAAQGREAIPHLGIMLSGGREGGIHQYNCVLTDAMYYETVYGECGEKMVMAGIPTVQEEEAYAANITALAAGFSWTEKPEEVYKLARYLMDYEFAPYYGLSVNRGRTETMLSDLQTTEFTFTPMEWSDHISGFNTEMKNNKYVLNPLSSEAAAIIQHMLSHMAGAGMPFMPLEYTVAWTAGNWLAEGKKTPEELAEWALEYLDTYWQEIDSYPPFGKSREMMDQIERDKS